MSLYNIYDHLGSHLILHQLIDNVIQQTDFCLYFAFISLVCGPLQML